MLSCLRTAGCAASAAARLASSLHLLRWLDLCTERQTLAVALPSVSISGSVDASPDRPAQARADFAGVLADRVADGDNRTDAVSRKNPECRETGATRGSVRGGKSEEEDKRLVRLNDTSASPANNCNPPLMVADNPAVNLGLPGLPSTAASGASSVPDAPCSPREVVSSSTSQEAEPSPNKPGQPASAEGIPGLSPTSDQRAIASVTELFPTTITAAQSELPAPPADPDRNSVQTKTIPSRAENAAMGKTEQGRSEAFPVLEDPVLPATAKAAVGIAQVDAATAKDVNHITEITFAEHAPLPGRHISTQRNDATEIKEPAKTPMLFVPAEIAMAAQSSTASDGHPDQVLHNAEKPVNILLGGVVNLRAGAPAQISTPQEVTSSLNPHLQARSLTESHGSEQQVEHESHHSTVPGEASGQKVFSAIDAVKGAEVNPTSTQPALANEVHYTPHVLSGPQIDFPAGQSAASHARESRLYEANSLTLQAPEGPLPAPLGPVHIARVIEKLGQSEMHIGLQTASFGSVQVHTIIRDAQVGISLANEKGDLRALVAPEVPSLESSFRAQELRLDNLQFLSHSAGYGAGHGDGAGQDLRYFRPAQFADVPRESVQVLPELAAESSTPLRNQGLNVHA